MNRGRFSLLGEGRGPSEHSQGQDAQGQDKRHAHLEIPPIQAVISRPIALTVVSAPHAKLSYGAFICKRRPMPPKSTKAGLAARSLNSNLDPAQYVVRPPDVSNTDAVVNEHSSEAMKVTMAADSSTTPNRPIGIFERI